MPIVDCKGCVHCSHKNVCGFKDKYEKCVDDIFETLGDRIPNFMELSIYCKHQDVNIRIGELSNHGV